MPRLSTRQGVPISVPGQTVRNYCDVAFVKIAVRVSHLWHRGYVIRMLSAADYILVTLAYGRQKPIDCVSFVNTSDKYTQNDANRGDYGVIAKKF